MRMHDVTAVDLTEQVSDGLQERDSPRDGASLLFKAADSPLLPDPSEPLLLEQEVPLAMVAREFEEDSPGAAPERQVSGLRRMLHVQFMRWREREHAERTTRSLVERFRRIQVRHPGLTYRDALRLLVMEHSRCDMHSANRILASAENSFATWPSDRDLNLVDVAHYLSVSEFLAMNRGERGIRTDLGQLVAALVPRELANARGRT
jgi:hypothetical protein